jgi:hypothetical protein
MVARIAVSPEENRHSNNLSVICKKSSAQLDPMPGTKWILGFPWKTQEKQTPQMPPKTPINFSRMQ